MVERFLISYDTRGEIANPNGDFVHYSDYARLQEEVETLTTERDAARKAAFLGCEANDGGPHSIIKQGSYCFCGNCGYTIKTPTIYERARIAEAGLEEMTRSCLAERTDRLAAEAERDRLREALRETDCPRPCNDRPDDFSAGDCFDAGECGCGVRAALQEPQP